MITLFTMFFLHIVDDYYLQGLLAKLKQKSWWKENAPGDLYKYDYIIALFEHAFSWSFMVHIPLMVAGPHPLLWVSILVNMIIHAIIDHMKANKLMISLTTDQLLHIAQIMITFGIFI